MQTLNVGIIGWGRMGKIRAEATKNCGHQLTAVLDTDDQRLAEIKEQFPKTRTYTNLKDLPVDNVDVIFICSPPCFHLAHIAFAIEHHLPFLIEKPLSVNAGGLLGLQNTIKEKGLINAVGYMNRYRPSILHIKGGAFLGISSYWINKMYQVPWWGNVQESGGPLNEQATHLLDLNRYIMGEVKEVYATSSDNSLDFATTISIALKFENGAVGNILYSCDAATKSIGLDLYTSENKINLSGWDFNLIGPADIALSALSAQEIFDLEAGSFFNAVINNDPSLILSDTTDAIKTQTLVDAVNLSLNANAPISLKTIKNEILI
ncbi:Gfo/Idh/MocA family oxidoreductase [Mucilaginibacter sp.]|uniref:Gfo/Idh/MocA family protein n=1 Tax=Mucilaginibacter sp. TaxID=1882438 RepID=UPI002605BC96|nr:Gfo/Idh/MocA family oxidoreductase [Mucilaginibacter sp.]MDB5128465.1 gfo/Idh/MocA family oxidoreductase [Mucilaginibacter sp.]